MGWGRDGLQNSPTRTSCNSPNPSPHGIRDCIRVMLRIRVDEGLQVVVSQGLVEIRPIASGTFLTDMNWRAGVLEMAVEMERFVRTFGSGGLRDSGGWNRGELGP